MSEPFSSKKLLRLFVEEHARLVQGVNKPDADQAALDLDALCLGVFTVSHLDQRGNCTFDVNLTDDQGTHIPVADIARELNSQHANTVPSIHGNPIAAAGGHVQVITRFMAAASQGAIDRGQPSGRSR
jgi:hypothetical protein